MKLENIKYFVIDVDGTMTDAGIYYDNNGISREEVGYIGDDLNDYPPMQLAEFIGCPADACEEIKEIADYISEIKGGYGAVRDIISYVLKQRGQWKQAISEVYKIDKFGEI